MKQARAEDGREMHRFFNKKMHLAENCKLPCVRHGEILLADLRHNWIKLKEDLGEETVWRQN